MKVTMIAAVAGPEKAIGNNGNLLFNFTEDMQHFRNLTHGHNVIMGRKTFDSLPGGALPGRQNIVVSSDVAFQAPGAISFPTPYEALQHALRHPVNPYDDEVFIIGGGKIYQALLDEAQTLQLTEIQQEPAQADTFFPKLDPADWTMTYEGPVQHSAKGNIPYRFITITRNK